MAWPTVTLSPTFTWIFVTVPEAVAGIGATAFSFSSSISVWSFETLSPSLTWILTTEPLSAPSPRLGMRISMRLSP